MTKLAQIFPISDFPKPQQKKTPTSGRFYRTGTDHGRQLTTVHLTKGFGLLSKVRLGINGRQLKKFIAITDLHEQIYSRSRD